MSLAALSLVSVLLVTAETGRGPENRLPEDLVVIVNRARPEIDISSRKLAAMFLGEIKFWDDRDRVGPVVPPRSSPGAKERFLVSLIRLTARAYNQHWAERIFQGEATSYPVEPVDAEAAVRTVTTHRQFVAILRQDDLRKLESQYGKQFKILTIDGKAHVDSGYVFKERRANGK